MAAPPSEQRREPRISQRTLAGVALLACLLFIAVGLWLPWIQKATVSIQSLVDTQPATELLDMGRIKLSALRATAANDIEVSRPAVQAWVQDRHRRRASRHRIPTDSATPTRAASSRQFAAHLADTEVAFYRSATSDNAEAAALAAAFLEHRLQWWATDRPYSEVEPLIAEGQAALDAGSQDPAVRVHLICMLANRADATQAAQMLLEVLPALESEKVSSGTRFFAASCRVGLRLLYPFEYQANRLAEEKRIEAIADYLDANAGSHNPRWSWMTIRPVFEQATMEERACILAACWKRPAVDQWITHLMAGQLYQEMAWQQRGRKLANDVTPEQRKKFRGTLQPAIDHLVRAWHLQPDNPEPIAELMTIAMAGEFGRWSASELFYECVELELDYYPAYFARRQSLLRKWGGTVPQMLAFGRECLNTGRYDTLVPLEAIEAVIMSSAEASSLTSLLHTHPVVMPLCRDCRVGLEAATQKSDRCPGSSGRTWGALAAVFYSAGDYSTAHDIFEEHADLINRIDLNWARLNLPWVQGESGLRAGPASADTEAFMRFLRRRQPKIADQVFDDETARLQRIRTATHGERHAAFCDELSTILKQLRQFHADEWVDLPLNGTLATWDVEAQYVSWNEEGWLQLAGDDSTPDVRITPVARFEPPYLVEAEAGIWSEQIHRGMIGIGYGSLDCTSDPCPQLYAVGVDARTSSWIETVENGNRKQHADPTGKVMYSPLHHLQLKVWEDRVVLSVNHRRISESPLPAGLRSDRFTIGEPMRDFRSNAAWIRQVRIRRLRYGPPPTPMTDAVARRTFFERELEIDPLDELASLELQK